jgi:hypothetical protein
MKLGRTFDEKHYVDAITMVSLCYDETQREIDHEKKLDEARS